ncbi:MAG: hypothetical protein IPH31_24160 [Lewinellaceae bacterium]|nr:hypothetical protein [Lewinellaceae bacterium]
MAGDSGGRGSGGWTAVSGVWIYAASGGSPLHREQVIPALPIARKPGPGNCAFLCRHCNPCSAKLPFQFSVSRLE